MFKLNTIFLTILFLLPVSCISAQGWVRSVPLIYQPSEIKLYETPGGNFILHPNNGYINGRREMLVKVDAFGNLIAIDDSITQQYNCREIILTPLGGENMRLTGNWGNSSLKVNLDPLLQHTYIPYACPLSTNLDFLIYPDLNIVTGRSAYLAGSTPSSTHTVKMIGDDCNIIWSATDTVPLIPAGGYSQSEFFPGFTEDSNIIALFPRYTIEFNMERLRDYVLMKTDRNGNVIWGKLFGVTGIYPKEQTKLYASPKTSRFYVQVDDQLTAYDGNGNALWTKDMNYNNLQGTSDGNLIACGIQNNDLLLAKLTTDLDTIWTRTYGLPNAFETGKSVLETQDKGFLAAGYGSNYGLYFIRTDSAGNAVQPQLIGHIYKDINQNCQRDSGEQPFMDILLHTTGNPAYYQNPIQNGDYFFNLPTGIVPIVVKPVYPFYKPCTDTIYAHLSGQLTDTIDIPVQVALNCPAVEVHLQNSVTRRCFDGVLQVNWKNIGTATADPVLQVNVDDALKIFSTSIPPVSQNGNLLEFSPGLLEPNATGSLYIDYKVSCTANLGMSVCSSVYSQPDSTCAAAVATPYWRDSICDILIGSFDPNDKTATPEGYGQAHLIQRTEPIDYLIRFQNTGTDTAFTVVVRDTLSSRLDPATLQVEIASHPVEYHISGRGILEFRFPNIMLPDSNVNEVLSHGYARYSIRPRSDVPTLTRIENRAGIYFDFNDPVMTNTVHRTMDRFWYTISRDTAVCSGKKFVGLVITQDTFLIDTVTYTDNYLIVNYSVQSLVSYHVEHDTTAHFGDILFGQVIHNFVQQVILHYPTAEGCDSTVVWHVTALVGTVNAGYPANLSVIPNPANDHIVIDATAFSGETMNFSLLSATGQLLRQKLNIKGGSRVVFPLDGLPNGVYLLKTEVPGKGIDVRKFVKLEE